MVEIFAREEEEEEEEEEQKESTPTLPRDGKSNDERPSMNSREESGRKEGRKGRGNVLFFCPQREKNGVLFFGGGGSVSFREKKEKRDESGRF